MIQAQPASPVLRHYAALEFAAQAMLQAAQAGDWDSVCRLEGACTVVIGRLRQMGGEEALPASEQRERVRILQAIVRHDAEIRRLSDPEGSLMDARAWPELGPATVLH